MQKKTKRSHNDTFASVRRLGTGITSKLKELPSKVLEDAPEKRRASVVEIESTLNSFSQEDFDAQIFINQYYTDTPTAGAAEHKGRLEQRRTLTADRLKGYVVDHYQSFIDTSQEMYSIENRMANLTRALTDYQASVEFLGDASFDFKEFKKNRDGGITTAQDTVQLKAAGLDAELQEIAEDLMGNILERKIDTAVAAIEHAHERMKQAGWNEEDEDVLVPLGVSSQGRARSQAFAAVREGEHSLVQVLFEELQAPNLKRYEQRKIVGYLMRLGKQSRALDIFLQFSSRNLRSLIRQINYHGDASVYIQEVINII